MGQLESLGVKISTSRSSIESRVFFEISLLGPKKDHLRNLDYKGLRLESVGYGIPQYTSL